MSKPQRPSVPINRLLAALPGDEYRQLLPNLNPIELPQGTVLHEPKEAIRYVYFPNTAVVSLLSTTSEDKSVEIGLIGREGMIGISVALGLGKVPYRAIVQIPGSAERMSAELFKNEFKRSSTLQKLLAHYSHALGTQIVQAGSCIHFHTMKAMKARLCNLLLATHDRMQSDIIPYTHDLLASAIGVDRSEITRTASILQQDGFIRYSRGRITLINKPGLETLACECYQNIKDEFDHFLGY